MQRAVADGRARKVAGRLYTRNLDEPLAQVVRRNWSRVAAHHFPGAVIVDRSGIEAQPSADGSLFLDAGSEYARRRPVRLPGLTLLPRRGPGPVPGDMPHLEGLYFSSRPRAFLDNMRSSRARDGVSRTLSIAEVEDELTRIATIRGRDALGELRDQARQIAGPIDAAREMAALDDLIGAILGTRNVELATPAARAAHAGLGFDPRRIELFEALHAALLKDPLESRGDRPGSLPTLSFIEAFAAMLERRPQVHPGAFKTRINRAGSTTFVHPDLVAGTLVEGYPYYDRSPQAWPRRSSRCSWSARCTRSPTATAASRVC